MSNNAPNWYTHEFSTQVSFYYQSMGWEMKGLVTPPAKIEGSKIYWPYIGEFEAYEVQRNAQSSDYNIDQDLIEHTWKMYETQAKRLQVDLDNTTIEANAMWQMGMARALGRLHTNKAVSTMIAGAGAAAGAFNAAWSLSAAATAISTLFDAVESDEEAAVCVLPFNQFQQMMCEPEFSSADFNGPDLPFIKKGMRKTWNGCHWYGMPKRKAKWAPVFPLANTTELSFPMWVPSAFGSGAAFNDVRSYVTWDNKTQGGGWDHKCTAGWGFKVLQAAGIIHCKVKEDSAISFA